MSTSEFEIRDSWMLDLELDGLRVSLHNFDFWMYCLKIINPKKRLYPYLDMKGNPDPNQAKCSANETKLSAIAAKIRNSTF